MLLWKNKIFLNIFEIFMEKIYSKTSKNIINPQIFKKSFWDISENSSVKTSHPNFEKRSFPKKNPKWNILELISALKII